MASRPSSNCILISIGFDLVLSVTFYFDSITVKFAVLITSHLFLSWKQMFTLFNPLWSHPPFLCSLKTGLFSNLFIFVSLHSRRLVLATIHLIRGQTLFYFHFLCFTKKQKSLWNVVLNFDCLKLGGLTSSSDYTSINPLVNALYRVSSMIWACKGVTRTKNLRLY